MHRLHDQPERLRSTQHTFICRELDTPAKSPMAADTDVSTIQKHITGSSSEGQWALRCVTTTELQLGAFRENDTTQSRHSSLSWNVQSQHHQKPDKYESRLNCFLKIFNTQLTNGAFLSSGLRGCP